MKSFKRLYKDLPHEGVASGRGLSAMLLVAIDSSMVSVCEQSLPVGLGGPIKNSIIAHGKLVVQRV